MSSNKLLMESYQNVRKKTEELCFPLIIEDYVIQSIDDVSPPKWHLAHTTWFFETFILIEHVPSYRIFNTLFHHLFNSYYQTIGHPYPRIKRGLLSRPTVKEVYQYRQYVDEHIMDYLDRLQDDSLKMLLTLGLHHEQQHQELLLMDIKHNYSIDPSFPSYQRKHIKQKSTTNAMEFISIESGMVEIGYKSNEFCFDNELPPHQIMLKPYLLANRLVTIEEYSEFIDAGGYKKPEYWLSDGWDLLQKYHWQAPAYWQQIDNKKYLFTLYGLSELDPKEPVSHISYYEADAYARFRNARLPREGEWENAVIKHKLSPVDGHFLEQDIFHPVARYESYHPFQQLFGGLWEWTASPYCPYPGYKPLKGVLGEYNGKFMSNQIVLRGGSCLTPRSHIRATYRNFFQPDKRWQFSGIRLAKDE